MTTLNHTSTHTHRETGVPFPMLASNALTLTDLRSTAVASIVDRLYGCRAGGYSLLAHSVGVARVAMLLARRGGLDAMTIESAYLAGLLHDAGKLDVADSIHFKPGPLTAEERAEMHRHPELGAEYLTGLGMESVSDAVLYHHERLDGSGYPAGLRGSEIPFLARLVAVADVYVAYREDRCYRPAHPHEEALRLVGIESAEGRLDFAVADTLFRCGEPALEACLAAAPAGAWR